MFIPKEHSCTHTYNERFHTQGVAAEMKEIPAHEVRTLLTYYLCMRVLIATSLSLIHI